MSILSKHINTSRKLDEIINHAVRFMWKEYSVIMESRNGRRSRKTFEQAEKSSEQKAAHRSLQRRRRKRRNAKLKAVILLLAVVVIGAAGISVIRHKANNDIKLNGDEDITLGLNGVYDEVGATAKIDGKDVSGEIKISGRVNPEKPGKYKVTYKVDDLKAVRTVKVTKKMSPEIVLKDNGTASGTDKALGQGKSAAKDSSGKALYTVKLGEKFNEPGYKATDENGKDLTDKVKVSYKGLNKAGDCRIAYTVEDSKGNKTRVFRDVKVMPNTAYKTSGLPICMYHYVYDEKNPPEDLNKRFGNYISMQDLEEELNWLNKEEYYYPTWKEVRAYVDGKLLLPEKSIVLAFDDGAKSFLDNGIPVLEKCKVPATCFMITSSDGEGKIAKYKSDYVYYESHSHNMHRPGGNVGHGGIFTAISRKDGLADLKKSIDICGSSDAFAYPYGDYNESSIGMVKEAGFGCAVTTQPGKAKPGDDPMLLPRVRMSMGQSLDSFIGKVKP